MASGFLAPVEKWQHYGVPSLAGPIHAVQQTGERVIDVAKRNDKRASPLAAGLMALPLAGRSAVASVCQRERV